ncbi:hypothetical protein EYF80_030460 [Liparis tanakae]|uniref:Uncharacterized protein n=1 Tax=Liparis tanakae TaxID=230148 RepID=A0A4Z2H2G2_9TELE|nr:hypothetical protein EYF80_030460 [Liparis tanakae]
MKRGQWHEVPNNGKPHRLHHGPASVRKIRRTGRISKGKTCSSRRMTWRSLFCVSFALPVKKMDAQSHSRASGRAPSAVLAGPTVPGVFHRKHQQITAGDYAA